MAKSKTIRVLGIDPALANFGWTIAEMSDSPSDADLHIVGMGCVRTEKADKKMKKPLCI